MNGNAAPPPKLFVPTSTVTFLLLITLLVLLPNTFLLFPDAALPPPQTGGKIAGVVAIVVMIVLSQAAFRRAERRRDKNSTRLAIRQPAGNAKLLLALGLVLWMITPFLFLISPRPWLDIVTLAALGAASVHISRRDEKATLYFTNRGLWRSDTVTRFIGWEKVAGYQWKKRSEDLVTLYLNVAVTRFFGLRERITIRQEDLEEVLRVVAERTGIEAR